jgi:catalase
VARAPEHDQLSEDLVAAAIAIYGSHSGRRALHAKGVFCSGTFIGTEEGRALCRAAHFDGGPTPALVRFSNGSGDPASDDAERQARGLAVKLRPEDGDETDLLATTNRTFPVRTPEEFLELLRLRAPDPETGEPDMEELGAFVAAHPEAQPALASTVGIEPPRSFATLVYHSPHAFRYLNEAGAGTWIRFRWHPEAGEERIPDDEARAKGRDYLFDELRARLDSGPVAFDLMVQVRPEGASLTDPTEVWPDEPSLVRGGRLEITEVVDDPEGGGHIEVFDPTRVGDGIELSEDPVLHARPKAYSVSAYRRLG